MPKYSDADDALISIKTLTLCIFINSYQVHTYSTLLYITYYVVTLGFLKLFLV